MLGCCKARYHLIRILTNKKWGPSPSILQICKQRVRPIFEHGSLSTITTSDTIISEIQQLQNKFIRLALRLQKYIGVKPLHDSSDFPYVKDRLLSRATRTLERISENPLVEESISSNKVNPAWDRFPTLLSIIRPVSLSISMAYKDNSSKHPCAPKKEVRSITGKFGTVSGLNNPTKTTLLARFSRDVSMMSHKHLGHRGVIPVYQTSG